MRVIEEEEIAFLRTLENGLKRLDSAGRKISNKTVTLSTEKLLSNLYDTFGFPLDLTALIAREKGLTVDEAGFDVEMEQQKNRSRNASVSEQSDWVIVNDEAETAFIGYDHETTETRMVRYRQVKTKNKTEYHMVLEKTPFYAESGGQVGDTGFLESDLSKVRVMDTRKGKRPDHSRNHRIAGRCEAPLYVTDRCEPPQSDPEKPLGYALAARRFA